jgi:hypothetical protein
MATKKAQSKAGIPARRRGQQMGNEKTNSPNKPSEAKQNTPALSGRRKLANKFLSDTSAQAGGGNAAAPRTNRPSTPAALPTGTRLGESGGERAAKSRAPRKRRMR